MDRHVLAAAIRSSASVIVTYNLKDFPDNALQKYGIEAQHPDDFLMHLLDLSPTMTYAAIQRCRLSLKRPPMDQDEYLACLARQSLPNTVKQLNTLTEHI